MLLTICFHEEKVIAVRLYCFFYPCYYGTIMKEEIKNNLTLMTCEEVATFLNVKLSTIYSWLHYGCLPEHIYRKLGRKPVFIKHELVDWFIDGAKLIKRR